MQDILSQAASLFVFVAGLVEIFKALVPKTGSQEKDAAITRLMAGLIGIALSCAVYYFEADSYSKHALGMAIASGGIAGGLAVGLWHGLTNVPLLPAPRTKQPEVSGEAPAV